MRYLPTRASFWPTWFFFATLVLNVSQNHSAESFQGYKRRNYREFSSALQAASVFPLRKTRLVNITAENVAERQLFIPHPDKTGSFNVSDTPGFSKVPERTWAERYQEAVAYHKIHENFLIPHLHPTGLGIWMAVQRHLWDNLDKKREPAINEWKLQALKDIGVRKTARLGWENRYNDLVAYYNAYGHTDVRKDEIGGLGTFVSRQRSDHYNATLGIGPSKLSQYKIDKLNKINFMWMKQGPVTPWQFRYNKLVEFKEKYGHVNVPKHYKDDLGKWVREQRADYTCYKKGLPHIGMNPYRIEALNKLDFQWKILTPQWMEMYKKLVIFEKKHGHTLVPKDYKDGLGNWVLAQRGQYRKYIYGVVDGEPALQMTRERIDLLDDLDFVWDVLASQWMDRYQELIDFKKENGHQLVPFETDLGQWVYCQRTNYRRFVNGLPANGLTQDRVDLLNEIDFVWASNEAKWMARYKELIAYKEKHGTTRVPYARTGLGNWVSKQRIDYRKLKRGVSSKINQQKVDKLNEIDFCWEPTNS